MTDLLCPYNCEYSTDLGYCKLTACIKTKSETIIIDETEYLKRNKLNIIPDNKLTNNDIIKGLGCCSNAEPFTSQNKDLAETVHKLTIEKDILFDKAEELKAKVERLKKETKDKERAYNDEFCLRKEWKTKCQELLEEKQTARSEAYKECLAKVKNYIKTHCNPYGKPDFDYDTSIKILNFIDNLVKEMVDEENAQSENGVSYDASTPFPQQN